MKRKRRPYITPVITRPQGDLPFNFNPQELSGNKCWFDFSDDDTITLASGRISAITDKLAGTYTVSHGSAGRQPVLATVDSRQVSYWDGARHLLGDTAMKGFLNGASGVTMVFKAKSDDLAAERALMHFTTGASSAISRAGFNLTTTNLKLTGRISDADSTDTHSDGYTDATGWHVYVATWDTNTTTSKLYRNGYLIATDTSHGTGASTFEATASLAVALGSNGSSAYHLGHIDQVFLLDRAATLAEVNNLTTYFDTYNGATGTRINRLIVVAGDSIANNSYLSDSDKLYKQILSELGGLSTDYVVNKAADGRTLATINSNRSEITGLTSPTGADFIVCLHAGSNDIATDSQDEDQTETRFDTLCDNLQSEIPDVKIVAGNVLKRTTNAPLNTTISAYNTNLGSNANYDALVDCHGLANAADVTDTNYFTDEIHPTALLVTDMADAYATSIDGL